MQTSNAVLTDAQLARVREEEQQEKSFAWPDAATAKLKTI